ncbi:hypothetical protein GBF38_002172 [Nibea albiflora]|uniref:Uncharacterized protein n=1 Tax=Nibea albiflora TaxID=240163 RepID=A0ACB7EEJ7_NIBAL|nr:hypothetical protein GBF38_002172 [Nibea albiflora]
MDDLGGSWSLSLQAAEAVSANRTEGGGPAVSGRAQLLLEILMVLMCLGAVTGNILVIVIVAANKTFHSVTSVLIMNLAISDLLVGVGVMPFVALSILNRGWVDCTLLLPSTATTPSWTACATAPAAPCGGPVLWSCGSGCRLWRPVVPPLLGWGDVNYVVPMYSCAVNWASSPSYTAFMAALSYLIPAVVILFCYVNIVKVARSHARRIHTLEDSVQRSRNPNSQAFSPGDSSHQHCGSLHGPSRLIYHVSGQFVSEGSYIGPALPDSTTEQSNPTSRRLFSFLAQSASQPQLQNTQQHHNHHGVVRLFLVISAFFLCWTPYIGVALVQATETAILGQSSLVPPSAVTFSYWLVLLNSDINPLLYALLSKRFQGALQGLRQKIRARLGKCGGQGRGGQNRGRGRQEQRPLHSDHHPPWPVFHL